MNAVATLERPVAKKRTDKPAEKKRGDVLTRIYPDALKEAKLAAELLDMSLVDYLTMIVKEVATRHVDEQMARRRQPKS